MERFRVRTRAEARGRTVWVLAIAVACVGLFELFRLLVPFQSINPLWSEATIGQTVLGNWSYGGEDAEGYLRFYDSGHEITLPPNAHLFGANGRFVVLEQHSPTSITYALPWNAIPVSWLMGGAALIAMPVGLLFLRLRGRKGWKSVGPRAGGLKAGPRFKNHASSTRTKSGGRSFRSTSGHRFITTRRSSGPGFRSKKSR
ncbi:hypothetical protein [Alicyclobacillus ferrooxydans]|uniref:hypothetical protein n=1 Tax=Alicyclobacillus ferrooxydans TaxID=471514 RepID=UPI0006D5B735|nr:hypothetical protein [Alicyclobacillus ferrooxydans]